MKKIMNYPLGIFFSSRKYRPHTFLLIEIIIFVYYGTKILHRNDCLISGNSYWIKFSLILKIKAMNSKQEAVNITAKTSFLTMRSPKDSC